MFATALAFYFKKKRGLVALDGGLVSLHILYYQKTY